MKKIIINISDCTYEKLRYEAMIEKKDIQQVLVDRILHRPFKANIEQAYDEKFQEEINKIFKEI